MSRVRRRRLRHLGRRLSHALEPRNLGKIALVAVAFAVIAAALNGPPTGAAIFRADLPQRIAFSAEESASGLAMPTAVPDLSASPRFELAPDTAQTKRLLATAVLPDQAATAPEPAAGHPIPAPPPLPVLGSPARPLPLAKPAIVVAGPSTTLAMLPVIPRKLRSRPETGPELAIVVDDLGPASALTRRAIGLTVPVTLAFLPYGGELPAQTAAAKARGHEIFLHLPMEPIGTPDPGPNAILVGLDPDEFRRRLAFAFDRIPLATGVNNHMGSRATADPETMLKVLQEVRRRGLSFVDSRTSALSVADGLAAQLGIPHAARDIFLDNNPTTGAILVQLTLAERLARRHGQALAIGHPYPTTLAVLESWLPQAEARGLRIVRAGDLIAGKSCGQTVRLQVSACVGPDCAPTPAC